MNMNYHSIATIPSTIPTAAATMCTSLLVHVFHILNNFFRDYSPRKLRIIPGSDPRRASYVLSTLPFTSQTLAGIYTLLAGMACFFTFWITGDLLPLANIPLLSFGIYAVHKQSSLLLICYVAFSVSKCELPVSYAIFVVGHFRSVLGVPRCGSFLGS